MQKTSNETDNFLKALRSKHDRVNNTLGDAGLYGAMSNYTGQSHLTDAITSNLLDDTAFGAGIGALSGAFLLPAIGYPTPDKFMRYGLAAGAGTGLGLSALNSLAKYYLGRNTADMGE